ncbi:MAG: glycosyltransferase family 10 [Dysgonamonadaceae bacterium]
MVIYFYKKRFNRFFSIFDQLEIENLSKIIPKHIEIIFDNKDNLLNIADIVVFDIPFSKEYIYSKKITKQNNQIWVAWNLESEANYPWIIELKRKNFFDLWMSYRLDSDVVLPYYNYSLQEQLFTTPLKKENDVCMFISSPVNNNKRREYIAELMHYINIDSYGLWKNNKRLLFDKGYSTKLDTIRKYKFTISFENVCSIDYVTEKFFDPLIVGSVPIYLGAPNIEMFSPGDNSFINVQNYNSPRLLAEKIKKYCQDESLYESLLEWKKQPLRSELRRLIENQKIHPFERLAILVDCLNHRRKNS